MSIFTGIASNVSIICSAVPKAEEQYRTECTTWCPHD